MEKIFRKYNFYTGRMICFSKSKYYRNFPDNFIVFNAGIFTEEDNLVWTGDLDLTKDENTLKEIAKETGKKLYVLREADYNFLTRGKPIKVLISRAVWDSEKGKYGK